MWLNLGQKLELLTEKITEKTEKQNTERSHSHKVAEILSTHFLNAIGFKKRTTTENNNNGGASFSPKKPKKLCSRTLSRCCVAFSFVYRLVRWEHVPPSVCVCVLSHCAPCMHRGCRCVGVRGRSRSNNNKEQYRMKRNHNYVKLQRTATSSSKSVPKQFVDLRKREPRTRRELLYDFLEGSSLLANVCVCICDQEKLLPSTNVGVKALRKISVKW